MAVPARVRRRPGDKPRPSTELRSAGARLEASEALFRDFVALTPYRFMPFVRSFDSFDEYERWRRAQTNPWYR
jgi:hypothetical protein